METVDCLTLLRMIHSAFQESLLVIFEFFTFGEIAINEIEKKKVKSTQANLIFEMNKSLTCLMAGVGWGGGMALKLWKAIMIDGASQLALEK